MLGVNLGSELRSIWRGIFLRDELFPWKTARITDGNLVESGNHSIIFLQCTEHECSVGLDLAGGHPAVTIGLESDCALGQGLPLVSNFPLDGNQGGKCVLTS